MAERSTTYSVRASEQDGTRLRPQLLRESHRDLSGPWGFAYDDADRGLAERWWDGRWADRQGLDGSILVPYPPESADSGIGDPGFHPVLWYRRDLTAQDLDAVGHTAAAHAAGHRLLLHLGAVDYRARVWVDGVQVAEHEGGHTPIAADVTDALDPARTSHVIVVRAEDDPHDLAQPRGKQDWQLEPHSIFYRRTSGIWQPVWLESVAPRHVVDLAWTSDIERGTVTARIRLNRRGPARVSVAVAHRGRVLGDVSLGTENDELDVVVPLVGQHNEQEAEELLWRPGSPTLLDAWVTVEDGAGSAHGSDDGSDEAGAPDVVASYLGFRTVGTDDGLFVLNERPLVLRSVLSQGFWPTSHLAASAEALRREAELILELGFNAARVHQRIEDPRFLFHADRLGLLIWGEMPAAYSFTARAVARTSAEWTEAVLRDRSHPCIVTWVPLNESWGVTHIATRADQRAYVEAMYQLTKALDPTRPVVSNDGWEHGTSDLWTVHDYASEGAVLSARYDLPITELRASLTSLGPAGRRIRLAGTVDGGEPVMLTEFGGVWWRTGDEPEGTWGYSEVTDAAGFAAAVAEILDAVRGGLAGNGTRRDGLAGWCWTQLTDTLQERNGFLTPERTPKLPVEQIRALVTGESAPE